MASQKKVRIVKKGELNRQPKAVPKANSARETAREMVQTVTNWVNELQQKRHTETAIALSSFLSETPRPNEV